MKRKLISLVLAFCLVLSITTTVVYAIGPCPSCGSLDRHQVYGTEYSNRYIGTQSCVAGHQGHYDSVYDTYRYYYILCEECDYCTPRVYFHNYRYVCSCGVVH